MQDRLFKICLILITLAILVGVGFYVQSVRLDYLKFGNYIQQHPQLPSEWRGH